MCRPPRPSLFPHIISSPPSLEKNDRPTDRAAIYIQRPSPRASPGVPSPSRRRSCATRRSFPCRCAPRTGSTPRRPSNRFCRAGAPTSCPWRGHFWRIPTSFGRAGRDGTGRSTLASVAIRVSARARVVTFCVKLYFFSSPGECGILVEAEISLMFSSFHPIYF